MNGNICRCGTYPRIVAAVQTAPHARWRKEARDEHSSRHRHSPNLAQLDSDNAPRLLRSSTAAPSSSSSGGGLLVCLTSARAWRRSPAAGFGGRQQLPNEVSAWIHIAADNKVTVFTGKVEVGQNIRTSLAQLVAEELMVPFDAITMVMGDTDLDPWDAGHLRQPVHAADGPAPPQHGRHRTPDPGRDGRQEVELRSPQPSSSPTAKSPRPTPSQSLTYGQTHKRRKADHHRLHDIPLTPAKDWKIAGTAVPKANGREFVTGKHQYPSDIHAPRHDVRQGPPPARLQRYARLARHLRRRRKCPASKLVRDGDFIGVVAPDAWTAEQALATIKAKWTVPPQPSNANIFDYLKKQLRIAATAAIAQPTPTPQPRHCSAAPASSSRSPTPSSTSPTRPLNPAPPSPSGTNGKLTVWTGTQRPFGVNDELVAAFHLAPTQVRVIHPDMGSGYGGKHTGEAAVEAARLAKAVGPPVRLVWTREEEFTWAYFRPAGLDGTQSLASQHDGTLVAWEHHNYNSGNAGLPTSIQRHQPGHPIPPVNSPLRQGSYRGLASTANHFARESFMDELAHAVNMDPLAFRLKNLTDPRLLAVLQAAADKFGWAPREIHAHPRIRTRLRHGKRRLRRHLRRSRDRSFHEKDHDRPRRHRHGSRAPSSIPTACATRTWAPSFRASAERCLRPSNSPTAASSIRTSQSYRLPRFGDCSSDRNRADRPQGHRLRRCRRNRPRRPRPRRRQRHLRCHRHRLRNMPMAPSDPVPGLPAPVTS